MSQLTTEQITKQSQTAYNQWKDKWRAHAQEHSKYAMKSLSDFENIGIGKAVLCVANGYSLELEIETIKKYQHHVDILCCDKSLGHLLKNGIKPTYCIVCDASVNYEKYLEPWKDQVSDTVLFANICANPEWASRARWKDLYFFGNMDVLGSEKEFMGLSGCPNKIPAGTNVSNAMIVFLTQSDNEARRNFFGYDKILCIGYEYSWREQGNYYAFDYDGGGKRNYMRHIYIRNINNDLVYTSNNLAFSAKWLEGYIDAFKLPVVQCSRESVLPMKHKGLLADQMQYSYKTENSEIVRTMVRKRSQLIQEKKKIEQALTLLGQQHYYSFLGSV